MLIQSLKSQYINLMDILENITEIQTKNIAFGGDIILCLMLIKKVEEVLQHHEKTPKPN